MLYKGQNYLIHYSKGSTAKNHKYTGKHTSKNGKVVYDYGSGGNSDDKLFIGPDDVQKNETKKTYYTFEGGKTGESAITEHKVTTRNSTSLFSSKREIQYQVSGGKKYVSTTINKGLIRQNAERLVNKGKNALKNIWKVG